LYWEGIFFSEKQGIIMKNKNTKFNIVQIKGFIGLFTFLGVILYIKINKVYNFGYFDNFSSTYFIFLPLMIFSIWLMRDWFHTWFK
jgi:hypothetical protein